MRGEHIEGHRWKIPAAIQAFLEKSHYILIILALVIGAYTLNNGLKDITPGPAAPDTAMVPKTVPNTTSRQITLSFIPGSK